MLLLLIACSPSPALVAAADAKIDLASTDWSWQSDEAGAGLGRGRLGPAGDLNGDGYADLVLSAPSAGGAGAVYVFFGGAGGLGASPDQEITGGAPGDRFGAAVTGGVDVNRDGYDDLVIGAPGWDGASPDEGAVFVFHGSAAGVSTSADWTASGGQENAALGTSVSGDDINGDGYGDLVATAPYWSGAHAEEGVAWVWHGARGGLGASPVFTATGGQEGAHLSSAVLTDLDEDTRYGDLLVGAPDADDGALVDAGELWAWPGARSGLSTTRWTWSATGRDAGDRLGTRLCAGGGIGAGVDGGLLAARDGAPAAFTEDVAGSRIDGASGADVSVCGAGDVDGNGEVDLVVGWPGRQLGRGAAWLLASEDLGWEAGGAQLGSAARQGMGSNALGVGDLDGDGYEDVLLTAGGLSDPEPGEGGAWVVYGGPRGPLPELLGSFDVETDTLGIGTTLAAAGDVDGDGYPDLYSGAPGYSNTYDAHGTVWLVRGGPTGYDPTPIWTSSGTAGAASQETSLAVVGDLDGDGFEELAVGGLGDSGLAGAVDVYPGTAHGPAATPKWTFTGTVDSAFGAAVARAGDVNGDGYDDLAIGATGWGSTPGRVAVYLGSPTGPGFAADWWSPTPMGTADAGAAITSTDVNGDGYSDLLVGDPLFEQFGEPVGAVWVFLGSATGLASSAAGSVLGTEHQDHFGGRIEPVGDVNGDGRGDVVVSPGDTTSQWGYVRLLLGTASGAPMAMAPFTPGGEYGFGGDLAACDVNGDGSLDLIVGYAGTNRVDVLEHLGPEPILDESWQIRLDAPTEPTVGCAGDLDGDGVDDIVVGQGSYYAGRLSAYRRVEE